jgi:hypothetical protein
MAVLNAVAGFEPDSNTLIFFKKGWQVKAQHVLPQLYLLCPLLATPWGRHLHV